MIARLLAFALGAVAGLFDSGPIPGSWALRCKIRNAVYDIAADLDCGRAMDGFDFAVGEASDHG